MRDFETRFRHILQQIVQDKTTNYWRQPIPCELDGTIRTLAQLFIEASPEERKVMLYEGAGSISWKLIPFAERMATAGVRHASRQKLLEGLLALIIENYRADAPDVIRRMCPLYHAAIRIGVDARELFEEAASYLDTDVASEIRLFPKRGIGERSLKAFLYKESEDSDGFRYVDCFTF